MSVFDENFEFLSSLIHRLFRSANIATTALVLS